MSVHQENRHMHMLANMDFNCRRVKSIQDVSLFFESLRFEAVAPSGGALSRNEFSTFLLLFYFYFTIV